jgi:ATP-binding cassette, subfamily B, multidrug efflux pump
MKSLLRLRAFLAPYRAYVFTALMVLIGLTAVDLVFPAIIRQVIDHGLTGGQTRLLGQAAGFVVGLGLLEAGLAFSQRFLTESIAHRVAYDMRNRLYDHVQRQPFTFHDHNQSGQIISRCIEDVRSIQNFTGQGVIEIMRISLLMVGISVILFINNPRLAAIALLPMLPLILITTLFGQRIGRFFLKVDESLGELSAQLQENVSGVQVVRAFAREPHEWNASRKLTANCFGPASGSSANGRRSCPPLPCW